MKSMSARLRIVDLRNQRLRIRRLQCALIGFDQREQAAQVFLQAAEIGVHVTDRIVDFVRHAGGQLADGGHLFRLQQLVLRAVQTQIGLAQFGMALLQLALVILLAFDVVEQHQEMPDALLLVVVQMRDDHPISHRQAAGPAALAARLVQRIRRQHLRDPLAEIAVVGRIFLAQALACDGVGEDQLPVCAEQQHTLEHLVAERAQHGRGW